MILSLTYLRDRARINALVAGRILSDRIEPEFGSKEWARWHEREVERVDAEAFEDECRSPETDSESD